MMVKIKTAEQLIEEFGFKSSGKSYLIKYNDMNWFISNTMSQHLGKIVEVEKIEDDVNYTHRGMINEFYWLWHELWFEPSDFFKEKEFEI